MKPETKEMIVELYRTFVKYQRKVNPNISIDNIDEMWHTKINHMVESYKDSGWKSPSQMMNYQLQNYTNLIAYHEKFHFNGVVPDDQKRPGGRYLP